jgi:hypothetical protein
MALTRRGFLGETARAAGTSALAAAGVYGLLATLVPPIARADGPADALPPEQHILNNVPVITSNGIAVVVPPLYHQVVTATLNVKAKAKDLQQAQEALANVLGALDATYPATPSGLGLTMTWGLPYFQRYVPSQMSLLPIDNRATATAGSSRLAILDAIQFPSDPNDLILEANDLAVYLQSDSLANIAAATQAIFGGKLPFLQVTSIRKGFVGGGFNGGKGLPKLMAQAAGVPGADLIPDGAELFLGFTSTQQQALGPTKIANLESLPGLTDQYPGGYFRYGTTMHLSHLYEDIQTWYTSSTFATRVDRTFRPGLSVPAGTQTVPEGPADTENLAAVQQDLTTYKTVGHSATMQPVSRLAADVTDNYGNLYPAGTAVPQRADFNTVDNPFFWSSKPEEQSNKGTAGLHFVVFAPTSDAFHRTRLAMDGHYPDGTVLNIPPRSPHQGFNSVLHTTHRQNFLVPPRLHRSFPLVELLDSGKNGPGE